MMCTRMLLANCTLVITLSDTWSIHAHVSNSIFIIVQQYQQLQLQVKESLESTDLRESEIRAHLRP